MEQIEYSGFEAERYDWTHDLVACAIAVDMPHVVKHYSHIWKGSCFRKGLIPSPMALAATRRDSEFSDTSPESKKVDTLMWTKGPEIFQWLLQWENISQDLWKMDARDCLATYMFAISYGNFMAAAEIDRRYPCAHIYQYDKMMFFWTLD